MRTREKYLHPKQELCAEHKYPDCDPGVHALCGVFDKDRDKYVCGCKTNTSHLMEIDVTANEQMAMVITITHSTTEDHYKEIPRDFFITKNQKINHKYRIDGGEEYIKLKKAVIREINNAIKYMMVIQSQKIGLQ